MKKNLKHFYYLLALLIPAIAIASLPTRIENGVIVDPYLYPKTTGNLLGNSTYLWDAWLRKLNGYTVNAPLLDSSLSTAHIYIGDSNSTAQKRQVSGDISLDKDGVTAIGSAKIYNIHVNASAAIDDTKLGPIQTAGKVLNSATSATAANTPSTIMLRDAVGQVAASTFTGNLVGDVTGTASGNPPNSRTFLPILPLFGGGDFSANRTLGIYQATGSSDGYLSSGDWTIFNNKVPTTRSLGVTLPLYGGGDLSSNRTFSIYQATGSSDGYLSSTDWTTFNNKVSTTRSINTTLPLTGGGDLSADRTLAIADASSTAKGVVNLLAQDMGNGEKRFLAPVGFSTVATPSNPPTGTVKLYAKSDGKFYKLTSAGVEAEVGGSGSPDATAVTFTPSVSGNWTTSPTSAQNALDELGARSSGADSSDDQMIHVGYSGGYGSTNTTVKIYSKVFRKKGSYITYTQSSTNGDSFTVTSAGNAGAYKMCAADYRSGTAPVVAISKNGTALTTSAASLTRSNGLLARSNISNTGGAMAAICWVERLLTNDVIRVQTSGNESGDTGAWFFMTYLGPASGQATLYTGNGYGSGAAYIRKFSNTSSSGSMTSAITQSTTNGDKIVAQNAKVYSICFADGGNSTGMDTGMSINASSLSTDIFSLSLANGKRIYYNHADSGIVGSCYTRKLAVNDEIRLHNDGTPNDTTDATAITAVEIDSTVDHGVYYYTGAGNGTESKKPYFSSALYLTGTSVTGVPSTYSGDHFVIAESGIYEVCLTTWNNSSALIKTGLVVGPDRLGSVNGSSLTYLHGLVAYSAGGSSNDGRMSCFSRYFKGGGVEDLVSAHTDGETLRTVDSTSFWITRTK